MPLQNGCLRKQHPWLKEEGDGGQKHTLRKSLGGDNMHTEDDPGRGGGEARTQYAATGGGRGLTASCDFSEVHGSVCAVCPRRSRENKKQQMELPKRMPVRPRRRQALKGVRRRRRRRKTAPLQMRESSQQQVTRPRHCGRREERVTVHPVILPLAQSALHVLSLVRHIPSNGTSCCSVCLALVFTSSKAVAVCLGCGRTYANLGQ